MAASKEFTLHKGKTFNTLIRWEADPMVYKAITGIAQTAPVRITVPGHGIPDGWRVAVVSVKGMTQINAENTPPKAKDYRPATVFDADNIDLNSVNAADFKAYVSGGYVQFKTPVDLTGMTARLDIKDKIGGKILASTHPYTVKNEQGQDVTIDPIITVTIDEAAFTITITVSAADTAAITWKKGVFELEMINGEVVVPLLEGVFLIKEEVPT